MAEESMVVGVLRLRLAMRGARSLKDKRRVVKGLKDRIRHRFNVAVAEVALLDRVQSAEIGVAAVGNDRRFINGLLSQIVNLAAMAPGAELVDYSLEMF